MSRVDGEVITIQSSLKSGCSGCAQQNKCGAGLLAKAFPQRRGDISVRSALPFEPGQQVEFEMAESTLAKYALLMYLVPLLALFTGAILGGWLHSDSEWVAIVLALLMFAVSFILVRWMLRCANFKVQTVLSVRPAPSEQKS